VCALEGCATRSPQVAMRAQHTQLLIRRGSRGRVSEVAVSTTVVARFQIESSVGDRARRGASAPHERAHRRGSCCCRCVFEVRAIDLDDLARLVLVTDPQVSADGRAIVVVVGRANLEDDRWD
jgi:hypothetical protein